MSLTRRSLLWTVGGVLLGVAIVIAVVGFGSHPSTPAAAATTTVARGAVTLQVAASGTVEAVQSRGLSFSVSSTVTEVDVKAGDTVKSGQILARVDPTDAQATVDAAQSRVNDAADALTRAEQTAALPACPSATARSGGGGAGGGSGGGGTGGGTGGGGTGGGTGGGSGGGTGGGTRTSPTPTPTGHSASLTADVTAATPTPTCTQAGRTQSSTNDPVLSAQQQLNNADLALDQARTKLAGTTITAPIAGRVLSVAGKVGSTASAGGTGFIVLGDISSLAVTADFSEADVGRLAIGQVASITLPDRDQPMPGKVSEIDPAGTVSSRLVRYGVEIAFDQVPADLLLGQSATVTVTTASAADVLYASSAAVTQVANGTGTVTVRTNAGDQARSVKVGLRGDQFTEIDSGVTEGDVLVLPSGGA